MPIRLIVSPPACGRPYTLLSRLGRGGFCPDGYKHKWHEEEPKECFRRQMGGRPVMVWRPFTPLLMMDCAIYSEFRDIWALLGAARQLRNKQCCRSCIDLSCWIKSA
ncbi:hypothetical protein AVEN_101256-1 [Araneus ventricosus]|uniref:Uncharacterized protein n=1 Tax=Araneus ventricosus TaxID=182803 RepID=A0A4Y2M2E4_ARAVE|nr:hypothetical protein AVEN_101256-1 [Araneus ventricosus]